MSDDVTDGPGDPRRAWEQEASRAVTDADQPWVPTPDDLPPWTTFEEFDDNYTSVSRWWERWLLPLAVAFFVALLLPMTIFVPRAADSLAGILAPWLTAALVAAVLVTGVVFAVREVRFHRSRRRLVGEAFELVRRTAIPVWAVLEDRVRVSGGSDTVYDLQFVFDLRVPPETLGLQRRVVEAWLDQIAATFGTEDAAGFPENFAKWEPVHCLDIFGDGMRGVWIWGKGSILPIQVLGLSVEDPQTTHALSDVNVAFLRRQPKELRRLSTIAHRKDAER